MSVKIIKGDITKIECDAIVNAANSTLLGGGGVDGVIHKAAGKGLLLECMKLGGCKAGQAKITGAHKLPAKFVIHTVGSKWKGGEKGEKELLENCYKESIRLAVEYECRTVAFPLISGGVYGYPLEEAIEVAVSVIDDQTVSSQMEALLVLYDEEAYRVSKKNIPSNHGANIIYVLFAKNNCAKTVKRKAPTGKKHTWGIFKWKR